MTKALNSIKDGYLAAVGWIDSHPHATLWLRRCRAHRRVGAVMTATDLPARCRACWRTKAAT
jgi:hypothetical protein